MREKDRKGKRLKGFRDFLAKEVRERQWLIERIKHVFERFGFEPLETPALEYESLLLGKYGQEAERLIYRFKDRGERRVALRYDQTVPMARVIAEYKERLVFPYRRYQIQPVWRADKPQKGRFREFLQCDADIIGSYSPLADGEILAVYFAVYKEIGLDSIIIKINDRQQLIKKIEDLGIPSSMVFSVIQTLDKLDKKSPNQVLAELEERGLSLLKAKNLLRSLKKTSYSQRLKEIVKLATKLGVSEENIEYEPTLARGLDYYTGLIFEGVIPGYKGGSVGGGGRYDNLIKDLVGIDLPGVGFGLGFDRILEAVKVLGKMPQFLSSTKVLATIFSKRYINDALDLTRKLREKGISAECYLEPEKRLDKQLKYADKKSIPWVIIIGPEERRVDRFMVKDMVRKTQQAVDFNQLVSLLRQP